MKRTRCNLTFLATSFAIGVTLLFMPKSYAADETNSDLPTDVSDCIANAQTQKIGFNNSNTQAALKEFDNVANQQITAKTPAKGAETTQSPADRAALADFTQCKKAVDDRASQLNLKMNSVNQSISTKLCPLELKYTTTDKSILHPFNTFGASNDLAQTGQQIKLDSANLKQAADTTFNKASQSQSSDGAKFDICQQRCSGAAEADLRPLCDKVAEAYITEVHNIAQVIDSTTTSAGNTALAVKVGLGVAAVGAVALTVAAVHRHNDAKARAKVASDLANGIIHNPDGTTTNCLTASTYTTSTCQPVLINYCSVASNTGKPGCTAFNSSYCSSSSASQSYCLTGTSTTYCSQGGATIAQSPACQWMSMRATTCTASSTDIGCMSNMSASQLQSLCPSFPNDPLCQSFNAGNVVTQPGVATTLPVSSTQPITTLNSVVGTTTSSSTAPVAVVPVGVQVKAATPVANVWANNSSVLSQLCQTGQLGSGCK